MAQRKNIFSAKYQGPRGAHLSCLTETSMYGTVEGTQRSIHHGSGSKNTRGQLRYRDGRITVGEKDKIKDLAKELRAVGFWTVVSHSPDKENSIEIGEVIVQKG
jgi:hypothetical protein